MLIDIIWETPLACIPYCSQVSIIFVITSCRSLTNNIIFIIFQYCHRILLKYTFKQAVSLWTFSPPAEVIVFAKGTCGFMKFAAAHSCSCSCRIHTEQIQDKTLNGRSRKHVYRQKAIFFLLIKQWSPKACGIFLSVAINSYPPCAPLSKTSVLNNSNSEDNEDGGDRNISNSYEE